jgi:hypothetical protein
MCQLQRRPEPLVAAALREIARRTDLASATNKSAYLTHWLMRFADDPVIPSLACAASFSCMFSCVPLRSTPLCLCSTWGRGGVERPSELSMHLYMKLLNTPRCKAACFECVTVLLTKHMLCSQMCWQGREQHHPRSPPIAAHSADVCGASCRKLSLVRLATSVLRTPLLLAVDVLLFMRHECLPLHCAHLLQC